MKTKLIKFNSNKKREFKKSLSNFKHKGLKITLKTFMVYSQKQEKGQIYIFPILKINQIMSNKYIKIKYKQE